MFRKFAMSCFMAMSFLMGLLLTVPAHAQEPVCMPWSIMKKIAKEKSHEEPTGGVGLVNSQSVIAVLASPGGDTWTLVIVDAKGAACVVMSGTNWTPGDVRPAYSHGRSAS